MNDDSLKQELAALLAPWGQEHLLEYWEELRQEERAAFAGELRRIDWPRVAAWSRRLQDGGAPIPPSADIEPAPYLPLEPADAGQAREYAAAEALGRELIGAGKVACFTVAGGQGTRLGYDGPKGTFPISPIAGKSLFQVFAESIARAREKYDAALPWFIMTSPLNDAATRAYFAANDFFGLGVSSVHFFSQGTFPAVSPEGKVLLADRGAVALSPNGHGGSLSALRDSGALDLMIEAGIEYISYWQVDNALVYVFDPLFIGLAAARESDMGSRSLTKAYSEEKLGHFVYVGDELRIIEYSDMPDELLYAVEADGQLRFRAGSPAIHVFSVAFVDRLTRDGLDLEPHIAHKKVPFVGPGGIRIEPAEPNAYKFEYFIFDALPQACNPLILEARREEQFAPVKNPTGVDSVETCQALWLDRDARWLEAAGKPLPRDGAGRRAVDIELSRRSFLDPEDVAARIDTLEIPPPGTRRILT